MSVLTDARKGILLPGGEAAIIERAVEVISVARYNNGCDER
jgi:hypothetical protein